MVMTRLHCCISLVFLAAPAFAALPVTPAPDQAALLKSKDPKLAANKKLGYDFFRIVLRARHLDEADKYMKDDYIQHNPNADTGIVAQGQYRRYFGHTARSQHERGSSMIEISAIDQIRFDVGRRVDDAASIDRGTADQLKFNIAGGVYHFNMGSAGTFYRSDWTKTGDFKFSARLTQKAAPSHPISYGLMIGGSDLAGPNQTYSYFLVRNQGEFYIANREGDKRPIAVMNWTANPAIVKQGDDGKQTNSLAVQVQGDNVIF